MVNHFHKIGGFDAIINRITTAPPASLFTLKLLIRPVVNVRRYICIDIDTRLTSLNISANYLMKIIPISSKSSSLLNDIMY